MMKSSLPLILVVDDEAAVVNLIVYNLKKSNFDVLTASSGTQALELARANHPDLILLDWMLPGIDGLEVCKALRRDSLIPIIMITAKGEEIDRVVGLEMGADDYICKPFSMRELLARVKAVLRRAQAPTESRTDQTQRLVGPGNLWLDLDTREAGIGSQLLSLTRLEFDLLHMLRLNINRVLTREKLLEEVWGFDFAGDTRTVDSAVKRLRAAIRSVQPQADHIEAVRGIGYKLIETLHESQPENNPEH